MLDVGAKLVKICTTMKLNINMTTCWMSEYDNIVQ